MRFLLAIDSVHTDHRSGAAVSMKTLMEWLAAAGHECRVLCSARFDGQPEDADRHLKGLGVPVKRMPPGRATGGSHWPVVRFSLRGVLTTMVLTQSQDPNRPDHTENKQVIRACEALYDQFRPQVMVTYGGGPVVQEAMKRARNRDIATVFSLHNYGYEERSLFTNADHVLNCSPFLERYYAKKIGLRSTGIPVPITWSDVLASSDGRGFLTFINPAPHKGLFIFARLVIMLSKWRPDIPILVVQSSMDASLLAQIPELDLTRLPQVAASPSLAEPADIFSVTKLLLVPSVFAEPFGRIAAEALINGVPPLVSDRGALPETVAEGGLVLPIPHWATPAMRQLPSEAEIKPWFDAVTLLWDNKAVYREASSRAQGAARRLYDEDTLRRRYIEYFTGLPSHSALFDGPAP